MKAELAQINEKIFEVVRDLNRELPDDGQIKAAVDTPLYGSDSVLDSLGLVNLVVAVEQKIEDDFGVTVTLADEKAMSQKNSPFRSISTLSQYIQSILAEK